jgi:hypothetical protein
MVIVVSVLVLAGCGGSGEDKRTAGSAEAAPEASPEAPATGPQASGDAPESDRAAITAAVSEYIGALDRHDAATVCALFAPGAVDLAELPLRRGTCDGSVARSIGTRPRGGAPAWRSTKPIELEAKQLGADRARVTATVTHHFSDRKYVSIEDDVIYLERIHGRWLLAKPSGTFYRAVGFPEPPLRALAPPLGW